MPDTRLFIGGEWRDGAAGAAMTVLNPATGLVIGSVAKAEPADLDGAVEAAHLAFDGWRRTPALERSKLLRRAADILRAEAQDIAQALTAEQGKPTGEAMLEVAMAADIIDWMAEEGRRIYGRTIPARLAGVHQEVRREPVGVVAAFTPWNFPLGQAVRKLAAAFAAGCAVVLKAPEETPGACAKLVDAFARAGLPAGVVNLVFGVPAQISEHLIAHPQVAKVSFTGSSRVGRTIASLAGLHLKRTTMELGGHAPVIVMADADITAAVAVMSASKFRNAGQICASPTRFLVEDAVFGAFTDGLVAAAGALVVGPGDGEGVQMGPLAHAGRLDAMQALVADARACGGQVRCGGMRRGNQGYFFEPTVITDLPPQARVMNEEPFGPIAVVNRFKDLDSALAEANRLPYGLASYVFAGDLARAADISDGLEAGMVSVNHAGLALPETPFGGIKDSGYGSEGGAEALDPYLAPKFVTVRQPG